MATCAGFGISLTPRSGSLARWTGGTVPLWSRQESLASLVCHPPEQPTHYAPEYASGWAAGPFLNIRTDVPANQWARLSGPSAGVRHKAACGRN